MLNPSPPLRLDGQTYDILCALAKEQRRSVQGVLLDAVQQYAQQEAKKAAFNQATLDAWEEYAESGLHANAEEVSAWLRSVGSDNERPPPVCHHQPTQQAHCATCNAWSFASKARTQPPQPVRQAKSMHPCGGWSSSQGQAVR